ncbi:hypothetical protein B566_EDAN013605 [Ephemera danica]|nr:hypothetical protein B566_EDAN013605 [Ephemera danica]
MYDVVSFKEYKTNVSGGVIFWEDAPKSAEEIKREEYRRKENSVIFWEARDKQRGKIYSYSNCNAPYLQENVTGGYVGNCNTQPDMSGFCYFLCKSSPTYAIKKRKENRVIPAADTNEITYDDLDLRTQQPPEIPPRVRDANGYLCVMEPYHYDERIRKVRGVRASLCAARSLLRRPFDTQAALLFLWFARGEKKRFGRYRIRKIRASLCAARSQQRRPFDTQAALLLLWFARGEEKSFGRYYSTKEIICGKTVNCNPGDMCEICDKAASIFTERRGAKRGLETQAEKMLQLSNKKFKTAEVDVDRSRIAPRNVMGVVMRFDEEKQLYQIGTKDGVLDKLYCRNEFQSSDSDFMTQDDVPFTSTTLRSSAGAQAGSTQANLALVSLRSKNGLSQLTAMESSLAISGWGQM